MKNKIVKFILVLTAGFAVFMAFGWSFFAVVVRGGKRKKDTAGRKKYQLPPIRINHPRHEFEEEYEQGKAWCREQEMQDCYICSNDNLLLHASFFPAEAPQRTVILCHGYKGSGFGDFAYMAKFLHENGCNLLFIDQRCCGESEGKYISFGALEQWDIQGWAYYVAKRNRERLPIYLYGESMGAASALMASGRHLPRDVKGIISDCGFQSMRGQLEDIAKNWFHLNWIKALLFRVNLFGRVFGRFWMKDADTTMSLRRNKLPILFFHGGRDTFVAPKNSLYNYAVCRAPKELIIIPGARHLCSAYKNPALYRKKIMAFFEKND